MSAPPFPYRVTPALRERLLHVHPVLAGRDKKSQHLLSMAIQLLHGPLFWPEDGAPYQRWPRSLQARLMGLRCANSCRSGAWLERFSQDVWPLFVSRYSFSLGHCRTVRCAPAPELMALRDEALQRSPGFIPGLVEPVSGRVVGERRRQRELQAYQEELRAGLWVEPDHPAAELFRYLNRQDQRPYQRLICGNWGALYDTVMAMAPSETRETARRTLHAIREKPFMLYRPSERTARLHAVGPTVHLLRRDLRKIALSGATTLDLRACQLAVAAKFWSIALLYEFLAGGRSIWKELLSSLGLGEAYKPTVKRAVYSACYGMDRGWITRRLKEARDGELALNSTQARAFQEHPLIAALLSAREEQLARVGSAGGIVDPFGRFMELDAHTEPRALLAQQNQAVELLIMQAALPELLRFPGVTVVSWLHDGLSLVGPPAQREACVQAVRVAINRQAEILEIPTWAE
jgi:hypothetical protein